MRQHDEPYDDGEWSKEERAWLDALDAERAPPPDLKARTVAALRMRGLLRRTPSTTALIASALAAAAVIVFVAGALAGYALAERRLTTTTPVPAPTLREASRVDSTAAQRPTRQVVWF